MYKFKQLLFFHIEKKQLIIIFFISFLFVGCGGKSVNSSKEFNMINAQGNQKGSSLSSKYVLGVGDTLQISFFRKPPKLQKEYRIHPNDKIKIDFTYYKELRTQVVVPPDGKIVLKKIGEIKIDNLTTQELTALLQKTYARTLTRPEIVVTLVEFYSPTKEFFAALKKIGGQNTEISIGSDGNINLPLLNDLQAEGLTPLELRSKMQSEYNKLIPELEINVMVKKEESKKILVLGAVVKTGMYQLLSWTTLLDAIALSGGYTNDAYLNQVVIIRRMKNNDSKAILINVEESLSKRDSLRRFYLKPYDVVYIPNKPIVDLGISLHDIYNLFPPWFPWPIAR